MENLKESKDMLRFIFKLVEAIKYAGEDGDITIQDVPAFFTPLVDAPSAIKGANKILAEITSATDQDREELYKWVADEFDIDNDKIELYIENVFVHVVGIVTASVIAFKKANDTEIAA